MGDFQEYPTQHAAPPPGRGLLRLVRAAQVMRGSSLAGLSTHLGVDERNLAKVLLGNWQGERASEILQQALCASGLAQHAPEHADTPALEAHP